MSKATLLISTTRVDTWYRLTDHQFSTVALIDNAAKLLERVTYDAYGRNSIGYAGYVFNAEILGGAGLYTVRCCHYDPGLGRWLERDPLGYVDGMSLYGYVQGNPLSYLDPFGLEAKAHWHHIIPQDYLGRFGRHGHLIHETWNGWYVSSAIHGEASKRQYLRFVESLLDGVDWNSMTESQARRKMKKLVKKIKKKFPGFFSKGVKVDVSYRRRTKAHTLRATEQLRKLGYLGVFMFGMIVISDAHAQNRELLLAIRQFNIAAQGGDYQTAYLHAQNVASLLNYLDSGIAYMYLLYAIMDEYNAIQETNRRNRAKCR